MSRFPGFMLAALLAASHAGPGLALDRDTVIGQFHHREWTSSEGAPSDVWAIAQTADGWLWFGGPSGLYRFDGLQFDRMDTGGAGRSQAVSTLFAAPSGELLIGFAGGGVSVRRMDVFHSYRDDPEVGEAPVYSMAQDADGALWAATRDRLLRFDGTRWQRVGREWNMSDGSTSNVFQDPHGTLWVAARDKVLSLARGSRHFEVRLSVPPGPTEFITSPDGRAWASSEGALQVIPGQSPTGATASCPRNARASFISLFDRDGVFWTLTDVGIGRIAFPDGLPPPSYLPAPDRLAKATESFALFGTKTILEDCEGNIWVSTPAGIHRFRQSNIQRLPAQGHAPRTAGFAAGANGAMWIAARSSSYGVGAGDGLWKFDRGLDRIQARDMPVAQAVCQVRVGAAWVAGPDRLWRQRGARFEPDLPYVDESANHSVVAMTCVADAAPWLSFSEHGLYRRSEKGWQRNGGVAGLPEVGPLSLTSDDGGRLWLGYGNGTLVTVHDGLATVLAGPDALRVGPVQAIHVGRRTLVGGETGLSVESNGRFTPMEPSVVDAFNGVTGIAEAQDGDFWINSQAGAVRIPLSALEGLDAKTTRLVEVEVFNASDGYPGKGSRASPGAAVNTMARAADGRIWMSGLEGAGWIDPARIRRNVVAPRVVVRGITTDAGRLEPSATSIIAAGTRSLRIAYTSLSFTQPERQRFRYRLSGVDENWVDAGVRREAFYTNLGPGQYRFEVLAANENGVWSPTPATLAFEIAPTFIQTRVFIGLCVVVALCLLALAIQARVRQLTARAQARMEERLRERERIARDLHDTLLQDTLGVVLEFRAATNRVARTDPARAALDEALEGATRMMRQGREHIQGLRSDAEFENLAAALARLAEELGRDSAASCRVTVEGPQRVLTPTVSEEAYRIGREALSNALRHSGAVAIEVQLIFGNEEFRLQVRDDGRGIEVATLDASSVPGHWGLTGMRERAKLVGGRLEIWSRRGAGTEIELRVPARAAYPAAQRHRWLWPLTQR